MASSLTLGPSVSLALGCSTIQQPNTNKPILYRPGDLIPAFVEVHKHRSFEALSLHGSLVGQTRVWIHPADREDVYQTMVHTHLNLSAGYSHALPSIHSTGVGDAVVAPLTFVLPELPTESKGLKSNSRLPPSCEIGSLYVDPWGRTYMQPLIEYALQVTLRFRLPGETAIRTISTKHGIKVTTAPHCDPPTYSQTISDIKDATASASADVRRSRLAKPFARMSVAMVEPAPVVGKGPVGKCRTTGQLRLTWETSSEAYDEFELGRRSVKIEYALQARTRYGMRAVGLDSRAVEDEARPNRRVETTHLGTLEIRSTDRNEVRLGNAANRQRCHAGTIPIPIQIAEDTVPTFSHCLASRDYVLLVKVAVHGLQHKPLLIRVPVQVCESVVEKECEAYRAKSSMYGDMLLAEVLPRYEDHQYSPIP